MTRGPVIVVGYAIPALPTAEPCLVPQPYRSTAREAGLLRPCATAKRRAEFQAGRLAAKVAIARLWPGAPTVEILRAEGAAAGRPVALVDGRPVGLTVSISHADGMAAAAVTWGAALGLDLLSVGGSDTTIDTTMNASFRAEAFPPGEWARWARWLGPVPHDVVSGIAFAAKEAALKWLGCGLRVPLHSVTVTPLREGGGLDPEGGLGCAAVVRFMAAVRRPHAGRVLGGWLWRAGYRVGVLLCGPASPAAPPSIDEDWDLQVVGHVP